MAKRGVKQGQKIRGGDLIDARPIQKRVNALKAKGMSFDEICKEADIQNKTMNNILDSKAGVKSSTIKKLVAAGYTVKVIGPNK